MATTIQSSPLHFIIKDFTFELSLLWISSIHSFNRPTLHMLDKRQKMSHIRLITVHFFILLYRSIRIFRTIFILYYGSAMIITLRTKLLY
jgi:ABC-type arginine/histidine transport system permease subunit